MRPPERIGPLLKLIGNVWESNPDLRLCQLLSNCFGIKDLYDIEDEVLEKKIKMTYKGHYKEK